MFYTLELLWLIVLLTEDDTPWIYQCRIIQSIVSVSDRPYFFDVYNSRTIQTIEKLTIELEKS